MSENKCPKCGNPYRKGARFCPECGNKLGRTTVSHGGSEARAARFFKRDFFTIFGLIVVVAAGYLILHESPVTARNQSSMTPDHEGGPMDLDNLPTDFESLVSLGNRSMDQQNYAMAAEMYRRALEIDPASPNVRTDFGACLHSMGLPERAMDEFRTVIAENPEHPISHFNLGIVFYGQGMNDSARYYWERYLELDPQGVPAEAARGYLKELGT
jgi:hypothetical protein